VRTQGRAGLLMSIESPWGQASYLARQLSLFGRLVEPAEVIAELQAVTLDQVRAAGAAILAAPSRSRHHRLPALRAA
jgi:predicted Zn-dependent peptidase